MAPPQAINELTAFKINTLAVISDLGQDYGLAIKKELEDAYGKDVHHGRLYPNLDDLVEAGYVKKDEIDRRTNSYELTDEGREVLEEYAGWLQDRI